jgi:protein-tyrosine phosphatase
MGRKLRILFVCMGNICRSPTAEGVFAQLVEREGLAHRIDVDSAGTIDYHAGRPPDSRMQRAARRRGLDLSGQRARVVRPGDFEDFDYILPMDRENNAVLKQLCPPGREDRLRMFLEFAENPDFVELDEVPDPYYGGAGGFEHVLDLIGDAAAGLLRHLREKHL